MRRAVTAGLLLLVGATLGVLTVTAGLVNAGSVALLRGLSAPSDQADNLARLNVQRDIFEDV